MSSIPNISTKLGEELPIFCEKCGYSLHGLPPMRCDHCTILQFTCPECGHRQPINTLRPAVQKALGRMRSVWLVASVLFRFFFFGWLFCLWMVLGAEVHRYSARSNQNMDYGADILVFALLAFSWGVISRLLLLRWRRGWLVGLILATLTCAAILLGAFVNAWPNVDRFLVLFATDGPMLLTSMFIFAAVILGATCAWGLWIAVVRLCLPRRTADSLLEWQASLSESVDVPVKMNA